MADMGMKDSGIEWIGNIPEEWKIQRIGGFYQERTDKVGDTEMQNLSVTKNGIIPKLESAAKAKEGTLQKLVRKGDFVINSRSDRRGSCGIAPMDGSCATVNTVLVPQHSDMDTRYYDHFFHTEGFADDFYNHGHGLVADLWSTHWDEMKRMYILVPPLLEQQAIADHLDTITSKIDAAIALKTEQLEQLFEYKKSLISECVCRGVPGETTQDVVLKDSGIEWIGKIPETWRLYRLRFLTNFKTGGTPPNNKGVITHRANEECPWISPGDIADNGSMRYTKFLSEATIKESGYKLYPPNSILLVCIGSSLGKCCQILERTYSNQQITAIMPHSNEMILPRFLFYSIFIQRDDIMSDAAKNAVPIVNTAYLKDRKIPLPSLADQEKIASYLDQRCRSIDIVSNKIQSEIDALDNYKKSVIYEYVTGKKRL